MGQSVLPEGGTGDGLLVRVLEGIGHRLWAYPIALWEIVSGLVKFIVGVLWHFGKATWTGELFPLRDGGKIVDQGKVVGYLDGGKPQAIGRLLAIPVLALVEGFEALKYFKFYVLMVFLAKILIWTGYLSDPGNTFPIGAVWLAAGAMGISSLYCLAVIVYQRKARGLREILPQMFSGKIEEDEPPRGRVYRDDDTLEVKVVRGLEQLAKKMNKGE
ncbi:hypothetical protein [Planifilum fimeticola]|uniref:hypothetical protein n=1 Tax=Planifilum fimeticola TaxID=201975 RepID=UPI0011B27DFE|nr:hypothetical protein [Planifilum fimeticola]